MLNRTILIGRITKDVELRKTQNGTSVVQFTLAVDRRFKKDGEQEVDFINCVAWNKTADLMAQYLNKGSLIGIDGRIQTRNYNNNQGQKVYVTEVVVEYMSFLTSRSATESQNQYPNTNTTPQQNQATEQSYEPYGLDMNYEGLPF